MTRSFSHYTDGVRFYLSRKLKIIIPRGVVLDSPLREQARSHIWNAFSCGSEPAREGANRLSAK